MCRIFSLAVVIALAYSATAVADGTYSKVTDTQYLLSFSVVGYGKQFEAVDTADVIFSVSARDKQAIAAKEEHDAVRDRFSKYLAERGHANDKIKLESTRLFRNQRHSTTLDDDYYICQSVYSMRTQDVDGLSKLQADLVELGVDEINDVKLFSSERRELEDTARLNAITDAKKKAQFTCDQLGWKLGKVLGIKYGETRWGYRGNNNAGFGGRGGHGGQSTAQNLGASSFVDSHVTMTFAYVIE